MNHPTSIPGAALIGGGSTLHPAEKHGKEVKILCACASAQPREGRPPLRFVAHARPTCRNKR
jgi:hypothetical protein